MRKEIELQGCAESPESLSFDKFYAKFIASIEVNSWSLGGGMNEMIDGFYIHPDGTKGRHALE